MSQLQLLLIVISCNLERFFLWLTRLFAGPDDRSSSRPRWCSCRHAGSPRCLWRTRPCPWRRWQRTRSSGLSCRRETPASGCSPQRWSPETSHFRRCFCFNIFHLLLNIKFSTRFLLQDLLGPLSYRDKFRKLNTVVSVLLGKFKLYRHHLN